MKKTLIALMALAGIACGAEYTMEKGGNLFADPFTLTFTISENSTVTGDYDILAAYYQTNGTSYNVNAFVLDSNGALTLQRGHTLTSTTITNDVTFTKQDESTFKAPEQTTAYTLGAGNYTIKYLGGTNGSAAANLLLDGAVVASFTGGNHNMNGVQQGGDTLELHTNAAYNVVATEYPVYTPPAPSVPEPATATLSLLALAGLAARRRRK